MFADTQAMMDATDFSAQPLTAASLLQELKALECLNSERHHLSRLTSFETQAILKRLNTLQQQLLEIDMPEHRSLCSAVCRLVADFSDFLLGHLVDTLQDKQHSIDFLQQELSRKLRDQHAASRLLQQTQSLRHQTQQMSDVLQLGSIL